jgi:hypothetical protein
MWSLQTRRWTVAVAGREAPIDCWQTSGSTTSIYFKNVRTASLRRAITEAAVVTVGVALVVAPLYASQHWLDRHFLPSFFLMRRWYVLVESAVRVALAATGVVLIWVVRPRLGRAAAQHPAGVAMVLVAAALALAASEFVLSWMHPSTEWRLPPVEPLRRADPQIGWTVIPNRIGYDVVAGRVVEYAIDASGYRVRRLDEPVDPAQPTVVFTGESVMAGKGLGWEESIPAQVGAMIGVQSANLAVYGYATDQSYLRLVRELPRFERPVAVVSLFMTAVFGRDLDDGRPHLGSGLVWLPAVEHGRLAALSQLLVPFRREATVERGIAVTREVLGAIVALAHARGATPLILVPQFNCEDALERTLRSRILDDAGLPYVFVEFDEDWRLPGDLHPNARTARAIAVAVAARLRGR